MKGTRWLRGTASPSGCRCMPGASPREGSRSGSGAHAHPPGSFPHHTLEGSHDITSDGKQAT